MCLGARVVCSSCVVRARVCVCAGACVRVLAPGRGCVPVLGGRGLRGHRRLGSMQRSSPFSASWRRFPARPARISPHSPDSCSFSLACPVSPPPTTLLGPRVWAPCPLTAMVRDSSLPQGELLERARPSSALVTFPQRPEVAPGPEWGLRELG